MRHHACNARKRNARADLISAAGDLDTPFKAKPHEQQFAVMRSVQNHKCGSGGQWSKERGWVSSLFARSYRNRIPHVDEGEVQLICRTSLTQHGLANAQNCQCYQSGSCRCGTIRQTSGAYRQIACELQAAIKQRRHGFNCLQWDVPHAPFNRARATARTFSTLRNKTCLNSPAFFNGTRRAKRGCARGNELPRSDWTIEAAAYVVIGRHSRMGLTETKENNS